MIDDTPNLEQDIEDVEAVFFEFYDPVSKPQHYNQRSMECIDWIRVALEGLEGEEAYCVGAALKYIWRCKDKGGAVDIDKAIWYLNRFKQCSSERKQNSFSQK